MVLESYKKTILRNKVQDMTAHLQTNTITSEMSKHVAAPSRISFTEADEHMTVSVISEFFNSPRRQHASA